jgi:undecaprenyl diphosphate synthase
VEVAVLPPAAPLSTPALARVPRLFFLRRTFTMQSTSLHAALILDGNGRWATRQGLPRVAGHRAGAESVRRIVRAAPELGVGILTLYAFSSDNWQRPAGEVTALLSLFSEYLRLETPACRERGIRLSVIGRRDRLPLALRGAIRAAERATLTGRRLWLRVAIDYSARDQILYAAERLCAEVVRHPLTRERFTAVLGQVGGGHQPVPGVDLLIRTGGEQRLSDFLLWECAYAELFFLAKAWPEFDADDLGRVVAEYRQRGRRFGGLGTRPAGGRDAAG